MTGGKDSIHNSEQGTQDGLTKREYFAAIAMQGYITAQYGSVEDAAKYAVKSSDALIAELNKQK